MKNLFRSIFPELSKGIPGLFLSLIAFSHCSLGAAEPLLNVSYDVTREFYQEYNAIFAKYWKEKTGSDIRINQSNAGSSKQVRSVLDGLEADVATMNNALDIEMLQEKGKLIPTNWFTRLPNHSVPNSSTILFLVRAGNPKQINDWPDLVKPGISVIIPNPKTSGNGRYSYMAAWGYAIKANGGDTSAAKNFVTKLFQNVPVLDTGGRGATTTFAQRGIGDVLLTFENEVAQTTKEFGPDKFQIVVPSVSINAENPVVWIDKYVTKHGTQELAKAYLEYLFSDAGQALAVKHFFRPIDPALLARESSRFKPIQLFNVEEIFGTWRNAQEIHFRDGGVFDQIYKKP